ncbi:phage tail tube protein [Pseudogemmobacter sonorensis]|uniref:phage tail tube protein n=1 Tax=Pseudogemmobacter sonorensis TaxID=2989681 RepID=UPI0036AB0DEF
MSNAMIGYDTRFAIAASATAGADFVELAEVFEITPPSSTVSEVEVTHFRSSGRRREFIAGLTDSGTASLQMNFVPGSVSDQRILALRESGDVLPMRITYPNGVTVTFDGFIQEYTPAIPLDDRLTATVNIRVTGDVVIAEGE